MIALHLGDCLEVLRTMPDLDIARARIEHAQRQADEVAELADGQLELELDAA